MHYAGVSLGYVATISTNICILAVAIYHVAYRCHSDGQVGMSMQPCVLVFQAESTASDVCTHGHMHTVVNVLDHETVFIK